MCPDEPSGPQLTGHEGFGVAVDVRQAHKSYCDGVPILSNFNMTVPQGSIYALLGSSGCGKTTMLSCIVGTLKLDAGDVFVFGQRPGTPGSGIPGRAVGYMPQGVTLYGQLSIKETFQYFGRICGMTESEISSRSEFLANFLDLPSKSQRVSSLSGGQQRRTSLAVCLLHEPSLLILDEPTVGVDPLLRESIWSYLCEIVERKKTTVIITTHYIEEARQSDKVGLMRNGRLLVENSPNCLLQEYNATLLEEIVLQICLKDENVSRKDQTLINCSLIENNQIIKSSKAKEQRERVLGISYKLNTDDNLKLKAAKTPKEDVRYYRTSNWLIKCRALFIRNLLILLRNPTMLYLAFFAPVFHIVIVGSIVGTEPKHFSFGVINPEIQNDFNFCKAQTSIACDFKHLSCGYLNVLAKSTIAPIFMNSVEEALECVQKGKVVGFMEFPEDYSEQLQMRFLTGRFAENETLQESTIQFRMDMSNFFSGVILQKNFYELYQVFLQNFIRSCNHTEQAYQIELPLKFRSSVYPFEGGSYQKHIAMGVLLMLTYFIPCATSSLAVLTDRKEGTLDRSMVAGASALDIMFPFFLTEGLIIIVQTVLSFCALVFIFNWAIEGSILLFLGLIVLSGVGGLSLGIFLAQIFKEISEAIFVLIGLFMVHISYIGVVWPIEGSGPLVETLSQLFPLAWVADSLRSIVDRGWPFSHYRVWSGFLSLILTTILFMILSIKFWKARP